MQQRQLRLGDILDDYCPRERRVTNHAVVAMIGDDVKQTRCTTCDTEHQYKHAHVPRQRKKADTPAALYNHVASGAPKRVVHDLEPNGAGAPEEASSAPPTAPTVEPVPDALIESERAAGPEDADPQLGLDDEGPVHRPLIRASLPRPEGQQPPQRPIPEFTIRQPAGRHNRFRARHQRGAMQYQGNRSNGGPLRGSSGSSGSSGASGSSGSRHGGSRPPVMKRHGPGGRKRSK